MINTTASTPRQVANIVVIVVAVILLALTIWGSSGAAVRETGETQAGHAPWFAHFLAGAVALLGAIAAQRWRYRRVGQLLVVVAALILLGALVAFRFVGTAAVLSLIVPAVILLAASPFLGPMPLPGE